MENQFVDRLLERIGRISGIKAVTAVKEGMGVSYPLIMLGSVCLLIACFPVPGWEEGMASLFGNGWSAPLLSAAHVIFQAFSVFAVMGIAYKYCEPEGVSPLSAAFLAVTVFLMLLPEGALSGLEHIAESGAAAGYWLGGPSIVMAIFTGLAVSRILCWFAKKGWLLPAPDNVPEGVVHAFSELVPGAVVLALAFIVSVLVPFLGGVALPELLNRLIQVPLQGILDTFAGGILLTLLQTLLFWAGVHGPAIVGSLTDPLLTANTLANQAILDGGGSLLNNPAAHIVTQQINMFATMGGCGMTLGLLLAVLIGARSEQLRSLVHVAGVSGLFNINEPIIFGAPIVFNRCFLFPFVAAPVLCLMITYGAIAIGFMMPFSAVQVLWPMPPILSGFLLAGWQGAVIQVVCLFMSTLVYLPFVMAQDKVYCAVEQEDEKRSLTVN